MKYQKKCIICNKIFETNYFKTSTCSNKCRTILGNQRTSEKKIEKWLESGNINLGNNSRVKGCYRKYIQDEQNNKCAICGISDVWNNKRIVFVLDHIDGHSSNNNRNNLRLVCPNCDSQLDTYKSKNKKSDRDYRKYMK